MTSQGSAQTRFKRAIQTRNLFLAELAAREMGEVPLDAALELAFLIADVKPERLEPAALRWHGRLELEARTLTLRESELALATLAALAEELPRREIVAYCRGPYCVYADEAVRMLRERGLEARRLDVGFPEWRRAGRPVAAG